MAPFPPANPPEFDHHGPSRRHLLTLAALVPAVAALLGSCSSASGKALTSKTAHETVAPSEVASQVTTAASACDQLGGRLLAHYLKEAPDTTAMASPLSLAFVMAILADGATDAAAQGYDALLGLSGEERDRARSGPSEARMVTVLPGGRPWAMAARNLPGEASRSGIASHTQLWFEANCTTLSSPTFFAPAKS